MPFRKSKGFVNVQGELIRAQEQNRILQDALREAREVLQLCPTGPTYPKNASEYEPVRVICERYGYGAVMACASSQWMESLTRQGYPMDGAHVSGPCVGTVTSTINLITRALGE